MLITKKWHYFKIKETPLDIAVKYHSNKVKDILLQNGAKNSTK